jgi:hypothetical protein
LIVPADPRFLVEDLGELLAILFRDSPVAAASGEPGRFGDLDKLESELRMRVQNELLVRRALAVGHFVHPWASRDCLVNLTRRTAAMEGNDVDDELLIPPAAPGDVSIEAIAKKGGVALECPVVTTQIVLM